LAVKRLFVLAALAGFFCAVIEPPVLVSPTDGDTVMSTTPEFVWRKVAWTRSYAIEVSASPEFAEFTDTLIYGDTSFILADTLEPGLRHYWRVVARTMQGDESEASDAADFYVQGGVELLTPEEHDSLWNPVFSWEPYPGASTYRFVFSRYADFTEPLVDTVMEDTTFAWPDSLAPATYFWRVRAFLGDEPVSTWALSRRLVAYRLADTYFPLYLGRKQEFEVIDAHGTYNIRTKIYDTLKVETTWVTVQVGDTFTSDGVLYWTLSEAFGDIGQTVAVKHDSLFSPHYFLAELYPSGQFRSWSDTTFRVFWDQETLRLEFKRGDMGRSAYDSIVVLRLPGTGVTQQLNYKERIDNESGEHTWEAHRMNLKP